MSKAGLELGKIDGYQENGKWREYGLLLLVPLQNNAHVYQTREEYWGRLATLYLFQKCLTRPGCGQQSLGQM